MPYTCAELFYNTSNYIFINEIDNKLFGMYNRVQITKFTHSTEKKVLKKRFLNHLDIFLSWPVLSFFVLIKKMDLSEFFLFYSNCRKDVQRQKTDVDVMHP